MFYFERHMSTKKLAKNTHSSFYMLYTFPFHIKNSHQYQNAFCIIVPLGPVSKKILGVILDVTQC